ncbi:sensor histidine kinase [Dyadobacter subterraneus]
MKQWETIAAQHKAGKLNDTLYLVKAQLLTEESFKDPALKDRLSLYRQIAWSDTAYRPFRVKYFAFLANHASLVHQEGYAIYYLQKMEEELMQIKPYVSSLNQPRLLLGIYGDNEQTNLKRRIAIIDSVMPILRSLPGKISQQSVPINTCLNAFTILKHAAQLYLARKDTVKVLGLVGLSRKIWNQLDKKKGLDKGKTEQCQMSLYLIEYAGARALSEPNRGREILKNAYQEITAQNSHITPLFRRPFERTILGRLIDFYIDQNQKDSANYYFNKFKNTVASYKKNESGDGTKFLLYSGKVQAMNRNYLAAYQNTLHAYELNDSIISIKIADIQNNMYASVVSEQRSEALVTAGKEKQKRNLIIFIISAALIITITVFVRRQRIGAAKAERQIDELNKTTQIQIAELEAANNLVQKRMGMELHDDIAGRLVNICNFIETKTFEENDPEKKKTLETLAEMAKDAYLNTRSKSHEWYFKGLEDGKIGFSQRIIQIVEQALPVGKYEKQIEIDDDSLEHISSQIRIHILRIIQEAVANILKHARASKVKLFIYEEDGSIALQIADNGRGFSVLSKRKGLGLQSLQNRIKEMGGSLEIDSSGQGTDLLFVIPLLNQ